MSEKKKDKKSDTHKTDSEKALKQKINHGAPKKSQKNPDSKTKKKDKKE